MITPKDYPSLYTKLEELNHNSKIRKYQKIAKLVSGKSKSNKPIKRARGILYGGDEGAFPTGLFETQMMPWSNFPSKQYAHIPCGPILLAQLTQTDPLEVTSYIRLRMKEQGKALIDGTPPEFMSEFLGLFGICMIPLSLATICPDPAMVIESITPRHVILTIMHMAKGQTSWAILYDGQLFHGCEVRKASYLTLVNHPVDSMFLLFSPKWIF